MLKEGFKTKSIDFFRLGFLLREGRELSPPVLKEGLKDKKYRLFQIGVSIKGGEEGCPPPVLKEGLKKKVSTFSDWGFY